MRRGSDKTGKDVKSSRTPERSVPGSVWDDQFLVDPNKPEKIGRFEEDSESTHSELNTPDIAFSEACSDITHLPREESEEQAADDARDRVPVMTQAANPAGDLTDWRSYVIDNDLTIPMTSLRWDHSAEKGQIRPLRESILNYYTQRLITQGEPVKPIKVFVKKQQGVYFFVTLISS